MQHPSQRDLWRYLDGELGDEATQRMEAHLDRCAACRHELENGQGLCHLVGETMPTASSFSSEGEFWVQLADKLEDAPAPTWPWVPYLPPVLLGALGSVGQIAISAVLLAYGLVQLGIIPAIAPRMAQRLAPLVQHPLFEGIRNAWLATVGSAIGQYVPQSAHIQDALLFALLVLVLGALTWCVIGLYLFWAVCWTRVRKRSTERGR